MENDKHYYSALWYDYIMNKVFDDSTVDNITKDTGAIDERPVLAIDTPDRELINNFKRWIADSLGYWNNKAGFNLEEARNKNERYYLGKQIDKSRLYSYQIPFVDNQIFVGVQSIIAYISGRNPACEITPADKEPASKVMAQDLETAVNLHSEKWNFKKKLKTAVKNMYLKRIGIIKLRYDSVSDDIVPVALDPDNVILPKDCKHGEEPTFIAEVCSDTVEKLMYKFPDKKDAIVKALGRQRITPKLLSTVVAYNEVWFTDYSGDGPVECVAWYLNDVILEKSKNPNYLYDEDGVQIKNFLDLPTKPYVFFNYLNSGRHLIDETTPVEQAIPLQDILNKRGRQIVENADTANSILVLKSGSISADEAENITRDPSQVLMLNTPAEQPIQSSFGEIPPHMLPNYVMNDKQDIKAAIHNILGTPSQFRGDDSNREVGTLGEARMMMSQASGRQDEIIDEIEASLDRYFKLCVQMMKVWYSDEKRFSSVDNDGNYLFVGLSRESIPDVANVTVQQGTLIRQDKERRENVAMTLAKMGLIDPYNLFKDLSLKDADQRYESLIKFKMSPDALVSDVKSEIADREAYVDFALIMNGQEAEARQDITPEHILTHREQLLTNRFLLADSDKQQALISHIKQEVSLLDDRARLEEASAQGMLIDPNIPITPQPPEIPPQQPPMPPQGMPPMMPNGDGQSPVPPIMPPMGGGGTEPPVMNPVDPTMSVDGIGLGNLIPGL